MTKSEVAGGDLTARHYKDTFEKIPEAKRRRILDEAASEFARRGFSAANINDISKNAGISIGSMYTYFSSKEDLFLTVLQEGYRVIESALMAVGLEKGDIFAKLEKMIRTTIDLSRKYRTLNQIYLDVTSEGLAHLSRRLSRDMETITAEYHRAVIQEAQQAGIVDPDLDPRIVSFCIDNIVLVLQFSYTTEYFQERMKIFAGDRSLEEDDRLVKGIMHFLRGALSPRR